MIRMHWREKIQFDRNVRSGVAREASHFGAPKFESGHFLYCVPLATTLS